MSISKKQFTKIFFHEFISIGSELYKNALRRRVRSNKLFRDALEYCKARAEQERNKKASKGQQGEFVINEEKYSRKISSREDISVFEKCDSLKEKNDNNERELFENYEEEYVKSFKNSKTRKEIGKSYSIREEIHTVSDFHSIEHFDKNNENLQNSPNKAPKKLKTLISSLIQNKKTLKDEVNEMMSGTGKSSRTDPENKESLINLQKKMSNLNMNCLNLLTKLKNSKDKLNNDSISKIEYLIQDENKVKRIPFTSKLSTEIGNIKKAVSIKFSDPPPITTLEKIMENEMASPKKTPMKQNLLRRKSTTSTATKFFKDLLEAKAENEEEFKVRKARSKSVKTSKKEKINK